MNFTNLLKTGAQFRATDKLGTRYRYEVVGIDLQDLLSGTGCSYIVLKNLDTGDHTCVEPEWFRQRKITEIYCQRNTIEVPCSAGVLCAENGGDPNYPEIFTYLRRADGAEIDIVAVDGDCIIPEGVDPDDFDGQTSLNGGLQAYLYGNTAHDGWTENHFFTAEELNIENE